jgi:phage terminase large subunit-like protein
MKKKTILKRRSTKRSKKKIDIKKYRLTVPACGLSAVTAEKAVNFLSHLKHTKGAFAGKPFILAEWQERDIIRPLFGTLDQKGKRQYRTAYIEIPRKNGKSEVAAGIALKLLFADKEMGGEVYSCAADRDQAGIVFGVAAQMVRQNSQLFERCRIIDSQKRIVVYKTASFYHAVSADVPTKHGVNPSGVIFDELHAQPNRHLWDIFTTGSGTRAQPLVVALTTAGYDRNTIGYEIHDYALKVIRGVIKDPAFFAYICAVPEKEDWTDERLWFAANPALGDFLDVEEMRSFASRAKQTPALQNTFRRFRLNQWVKQEVRWMPMDAWDAAAGGEIDSGELEGMKCYVGLDLSSSIDIAAAVFLFPFGDLFKILPFFFIPEDSMYIRSKKDRVPYDVWERQGHVIATEGNVIDYKAIFNKIEEMNKKVHILEIAYDRWGMTQLSQDLAGAGYTMVPFGQGFASMAAPTRELIKLVLEKKIEHGANPPLRWMADNMAVEQDAAGNQKPSKKGSRERIDGMVALIMALGRAIAHASVKRSVYETRGIATVG